MLFDPQQYNIPDIAGEPFIDPGEISGLLEENHNPSPERMREIIGKSMSRQRLNLSETAALLGAGSDQRKMVLNAAQKLKREVYGKRIVLFAPLYIGNDCTNSCKYCTFRVTNKLAVRRTLARGEIIREVESLEDMGHKRLILVYGEHPAYDAEYIADTVRTTYSVKKGNGEIRRVNINAAPMSVEGFETIKKAGIGTYQIFQETYDPESYAEYHPAGRKRDYAWRLTALDRAMKAGIDDVGLGALLGLYHWQFEVMGLVRHTNHLEACFGVGPHTISFPRIKEAMGAVSGAFPVSDEDFIYAIAVLRLAVPYAGLILTAREDGEVRDAAIRYGVSQIDGGTKLEIGSYSSGSSETSGSGQFAINDNRTLSEIINRLIDEDYIPSFCTACYRKGRTGEHFMEFSTRGFIKRFCTPNALLTLAEYLEDYAAADNEKSRGWDVITCSVEKLEEDFCNKSELEKRLKMIRQGSRDFYF